MKAEGASILIAPVDFAEHSKILFIRFQAATAIPSLFELNLSARFMFIIIGPTKRKPYLFEMGRVMATCLADDLCRELLYVANKRDDLIDAINYLSRSTMALPPASWDPKIRIEPPDRYMSIKDRTDAHDITEYIHDERMDEDSHVDPSLKADKIPFSGLIMDIRRKLPWVVSDITDCLNVKCIAAIIYMYLVSLCSLVAFGALFGLKTDECIGTMECILAGAVSGILFALFSGQPLNLLSATGPMLILEYVISTQCKKLSFDFLEFRLWVGLWIAFFLLLMVMFNLSFLVKFITRFTEDCFASLIAINFIFNAFKNVIKINSKYPMVRMSGSKNLTDNCTCFESNSTNTTTLISDTTMAATLEHSRLGALVPGVSSLTNCLALNGEWMCAKVSKQYYPDIFIFSVLLFIIGFLICIFFERLRDSPFFPSGIRRVLSDFSVLISILIISVINALVGINTPKLFVPSKFSPTRDRTWFIPFFGKNPWWTIFLAIPPAIIATLLVFMDQQITAVIVNRKEFKLKKGFGYHLDLLIVAIQIVVCSMFGLPWFVAATVLALTHVNALKEMSENSAPGEKPTFLGVREQRVTALLTSILIGLSVFFTKVLSYIPMPVLYAVFLHMGVSALGGLEVIDRVLLIMMPTKYQPDHKFLTHVNSNRVHLFTLIQVLMIAGMFAVLIICLIHGIDFRISNFHFRCCRSSRSKRLQLHSRCS
jgi:anion exchange protein